MNWQIFGNQQFIENVGWVLIHSLWQISLIAALLFISLRIFKNASANLRYLLCVSALFLTIATPTATFLTFSPQPAIKNETTAADFDRQSSEFSAQTITENNLSHSISATSLKTGTAAKSDSRKSSDNLKNGAENILGGLIPYFVWFWLFGVLFFSFRLGGGFWRNYRIKTRGISPVGREWQEKFDGLCEKINIRRRVGFLQSEFVETPLVVGWLKPLVIVPSSVLLGLSARELETIIAHELIHVRRHDYLVNILQSFVEILLFFHPLTWWISAQVRRERENACDDEVLKTYDGEPLLYANALANLEDFRFRANNLSPSTIIAANGGNLMQRIQRITKKAKQDNYAGNTSRSAIPIFLFVAAFLSIILIAGLKISASKEENKSNVQTKKIAIGLYAASSVIPSDNSSDEDKETMRQVIAKLKQYKLPTTGFLMSVKVNVREPLPADQNEIVSLWNKAGFEIGLLDLKYPQSFNSTINQYQAALKSREEMLDPYMKKQLEFLKESRKENLKNSSPEDAKKKIALMKERMNELDNVVKEWMKENNLTSVKYTFGTHDWIYSYTYDFARKEKDTKTMNRIKAQYIDYMSKSLEHYENYAKQIFERDIPQTIPLVSSRLLADSADELFTMFKNHGYQFVSMDEAMQDESYQLGRVFTNGTGKSWLESSAMERGKPFLNKPNVDLDVLKIWEENQPINRKIIEE